MTWDNIQQILRIIIYAVVGYFFGAGVADGEIAQAAIAGAVALGNFFWTYVWNKNREA